MFNLTNTNVFNNLEFDYRIITVYPTLTYFFYIFCSKYYKYLLRYNLLILDMYYTFPETSKDFRTSIISNKLFRQFDMYDNTYPNYHDDINIALNEIPT